MTTLAELQAKRGGEITRRRILEAARARFSTASYEDVKLRDIAAAVGVDVALVHRAFGSKEQLFSAVLLTSNDGAAHSALDASRLSADFAEGFFGVRHNDTLQIVVRSLTNPQAREVLRARSLSEFIGPVAAALEGSSKLERATLFNACLVGMAIFREVLGAEALQDANSAKTRPLIERILSACLAEDGAAAESRDVPTAKEYPPAETSQRGKKMKEELTPTKASQRRATTSTKDRS
jgi:AcrR family transcriptional regulator